ARGVATMPRWIGFDELEIFLEREDPSLFAKLPLYLPRDVVEPGKDAHRRKGTTARLGLQATGWFRATGYRLQTTGHQPRRSPSDSETRRRSHCGLTLALALKPEACSPAGNRRNSSSPRRLESDRAFRP